MDVPLQIEDREVEDGRLRILRMHRPEARNAMDSAMLAALVDALDDADRDEDLRGLLLTGAGDVFSAGADIHEPMEDGGRRRMELFTSFYERLTLLRLPTAAAVEGYAVGGGAEAAAACDLRTAGRSSQFRFPGAIYGIPVGTSRTVGQVGLSVARDWVLSSRFVDADEAYATGFLQRLVDDGDAEDAGLEWLTTVASRDPDTVALLKHFFLDASGLRDRVAFENDALRTQVETGGLDGIAAAIGWDRPRTVRPRRGLRGGR